MIRSQFAIAASDELIDLARVNACVIVRACARCLSGGHNASGIKRLSRSERFIDARGSCRGGKIPSLSLCLSLAGERGCILPAGVW